MIFISFLVSVSLIVTLVTYMAARGISSSRELWFVIGMMALSVVVFAAFTIIKLYRGKYARMLDVPYFAEYEKARDALNVAELSQAERREVKEDVLSMLIDAQKQGRSAQDVTGGDTDAFISRIRGAFGYRSTFVFNACSSVQFGIFLVSFLQSVNYMRMGGLTPFFESGLGLIMLIMYVPLVFLIYPLLRSAVRRQKPILMAIVLVVYATLFIGLIIVLDNTAYHVAWVRYILDTDVAVIFSWTMVIALAALAAIAQTIKWVLRQRSLRML